MDSKIAEAKRQRIEAETAVNRLLGAYLVQHGRFPKDSGYVPHAALHAERLRRLSLQKQLAERDARSKFPIGARCWPLPAKPTTGQRS